MRKFLRLTAIAAITSVPFVGCSDDDTIGFTPIGEAGAGGSGGRPGGGGAAGSSMSGSGGMMAMAGTGGAAGASGASGAAGDGGSAGTSGNACSLTECGTECVDTTTTEAHCGACDRDCSSANGSAPVCSAGLCAATCNAGFADCSVDDGSGADDGCETDLNQNAACGTTCVNRVACNVGDFCVDGACVDTCDSPDTQCGAECVSLETSSDHCNACDRACDNTNAASVVCTSSACAPSCNAGFGDCLVDDGSGADDGCETNLNSPASCGTSCGGLAVCAAGDNCVDGQCVTPCADTQCGAECVDLGEVAAHCGGCDRACSTANTDELACTGGFCTPSCDPGFADCLTDDGVNDNGCETNLNSVETCGLSCDALQVCGAGQTCDNGVCTSNCSQTECGLACVDLDTAAEHCGACDRACSTDNVATGVCTDGACAPVCADDFGDCNPDTGSGNDGGSDDGCETDFNADETCGLDCDNLVACQAGESCVAGACCALTACGEECVDTDTTVTDCGACDRGCRDDAAVASTSCAAGLCEPVCEAGFDDCIADTGSGADNGCETNLNAETTCGTGCGLTVACTAGNDCISNVCSPFNIVTNPSAEAGALSPWTGVSGANVALTVAEANTGVQSVTSVGRTATFQGVGVNLTSAVVQGQAYNASGFMRTSAPSTNQGRFSARADCTGGATANFFLFIAQTAVSSTAWTQLSGQFTVPTLAQCPTMTGFFVYFENADGNPTPVQILADDIVVDKR